MNPRVTNYDIERKCLTIELDTGGKLEISFEHETIDLNGIGFEYNFTDDDLKDIFYKIDGQFYSVLQILQWSEYNHPDIRQEALNEEAAENDYVREVSCPYLSGRV